MTITSTCPEIKAATWESEPSDICTQQTLKSARTSTQFDQSLRCRQEETFYPWLSKMHPVKILVKLRECTDFALSTCPKVNFLTLRLVIQSTPVISNFKGLVKHFEISLLRHIWVERVRKTLNRTTTFNKWICNLTPEVRNIYIK